MKKIILLFLSFVVFYKSYALTFYFKPAQSDLTVPANWGQNTDGSGTAPTTFTSPGDIFIIASNEILNSNWVMNQTLQIGVTTVAGVTLTVSGSGSIIASSINITSATSGKNTLQIDNDAAPNLGTLDITSTVNYNKSGGTQAVANGTYGNIIIGNGGTKLVNTGNSTLVINGKLEINNTTLELPTGGSNPIITGNFTTSSSNPSNSFLLIKSTSTTPITSGITYAFRVEYNGTTTQTIIPGIYNERLEIHGARGTNVNVECVPLGVYEIRYILNSGNGPFVNSLNGSGNSEYSGTGKLDTKTSNFKYNGTGGTQNIQHKNLVYYDLTLGNSGTKEAQSNVKVSNVVSIEDGVNVNASFDFQSSTGSLQYKNMGTRTRVSLQPQWDNNFYIGNIGTPKKVIIETGTTINIDDPDGNATQCRFIGSSLEIRSGGIVNLITNRSIQSPPALPVSRLDLFNDLIVSGTGQLNGISASVIHISGSDNQNIGKINTLGSIKLDHQSGGTTSFTDNIICGNLRMFTPYVGNIGGTYSFNANASLTVNGNAILGKGILQLNNTANAAGVFHSHNITGDLTIRLDTINTAAIPTIDFSSQNVGSTESVILNVGGNFTKTAGTMIASNGSSSVAGRVNFNGTAQTLYNTTAGSTNTEVNFHVVSPSVSTLTNNFDINTAGETLEVDNGGTLVFDATKLVTGGIFKLNSGGTIRTANLAGINSSGASGSVQTNTRTFNSGGSLHYNGAALQNTGIFTTTPALLTVNNLTVQNASNVNGQQAFTVNGACTLSNGKFIIGTPQIMTLNGTFSGSNANSLVANGATDIFIGGGASALGTLFFDQTTAGKSFGTGPTDFTPLSPGTTNRLNNLTINRPGGNATLGNEIQITNTVTPTAGTLASNGNLVMLSTQSISSSIGTITAGTSDVTGNVNVQSFFTGGYYLTYRGTRMISSPIQEVAFPNNFFSKMKDRFVITGPGGTANGFDEGGVKQPFATTLIRYVEIGTPTTSYATIKNINEAITIGRGYFFFYRGNKSNSATASPAPSKTNDATGEVFAPVEDWTATYIGNINKGDITLPGLTVTNLGTDAYAGFHLIGNPYPSTINFAAFRSDNINVDDYLCVVKKTRDGYAVRSGGYNNNTTNPLAVFGSSNIPDDLRNIQPGQGFYVRLNTAGSVTFKESHKVAGTTPVRLLNTKDNKLLANTDTDVENSKTQNQNIVLRYYIQDTVNYEQATTVFGDNNDANYKDYDAAYNGGGILGTSTLTADNKNVSINFMPTLNKVDEILIGVSAINSNKNLKLNFTEISDLVTSKELILKDNYLKTFTRLDTANNQYSFEIDKQKPATFGNNRFGLLMKQRAMQITNFKATKQNEGNLLTWLCIQQTNADSCIVEKSTDGITYYAIKTFEVKGNSTLTQNYSYLDATPAKGTNYYRLKIVNLNGKFTNTDIIRVNYDLNQSNLVTIYPNPVKDVINISINLTSSIRKSIQIYDVSGKLLKNYDKVVKNNFSEDVSDLGKAMYILKIKNTDTNKIIYTGKFIKE